MQDSDECDEFCKPCSAAVFELNNIKNQLQEQIVYPSMQKGPSGVISQVRKIAAQSQVKFYTVFLFYYHHLI